MPLCCKVRRIIGWMDGWMDVDGWMMDVDG